MRHAFPLLLTLAACSPALKQGKALMEAGSYDDAAGYWLESLDGDVANGDEPNGKVRRALRKNGQQMAHEILDQARDLEAEDRHEEALDAYAHLEARLERLDQYGVRTFVLDADLEAEKAAVRHDLAAYRYEQGRVAMVNNDWADAITWFESAHEADPGFKDLEQQLSDAHAALAHRAYAGQRYDEAVDHFQKANTWSPDPELTAWSGAIRAALGRYYLKQGACRRATALFEAARHEAINEPRLGQDLATARDCAEVDLVVEPFEIDESLTVKDTDLSQLAADKLSEQLFRTGSEHVKLIDPTIHSGQKLYSHAGRRYVIRSRVSRLTLSRPDEKKVYRTLTGIERELCPGVEGYYTTREEYCDDEVEVRFKQTTTEAGIKLTTSLKVVSPLNGEQALTRTLESEHREVRVFAEQFQKKVGDDWTAVEVGAEPAEDLVAISEKALEMRSHPEPLPADADLLTLGLETVAREAAEAILGTLDREPEVAKPRLLANVNEPVMNPADLELFGGEVIHQPDPYKVKDPVEPPPEEAPVEEALPEDPAPSAPPVQANGTQDLEAQP